MVKRTHAGGLHGAELQRRRQHWISNGCVFVPLLCVLLKSARANISQAKFSLYQPMIVRQHTEDVFTQIIKGW
jgi:hypothetical protein